MPAAALAFLFLRLRGSHRLRRVCRPSMASILAALGLRLCLRVNRPSWSIHRARLGEPYTKMPAAALAFLFLRLRGSHRLRRVLGASCASPFGFPSIMQIRSRRICVPAIHGQHPRCARTQASPSPESILLVDSWRLSRKADRPFQSSPDRREVLVTSSCVCTFVRV